MRRITVAVGVLFLVTCSTLGAYGQGKDPFRPPPEAGSGIVAPEPAAPPIQPVPPDQTPSGDGLARTGQDVEVQLSLAVVLLLLGVALRTIEAAVVCIPAVASRGHPEGVR